MQEVGLALAGLPGLLDQVDGVAQDELVDDGAGEDRPEDRQRRRAALHTGSMPTDEQILEACLRQIERYDAMDDQQVSAHHWLWEEDVRAQSAGLKRSVAHTRARLAR